MNKGVSAPQFEHKRSWSLSCVRCCSIFSTAIFLPFVALVYSSLIIPQKQSSLSAPDIEFDLDGCRSKWLTALEQIEARQTAADEYNQKCSKYSLSKLSKSQREGSAFYRQLNWYDEQRPELFTDMRFETKNPYPLKNKVAIVTGASSGIGKGIAKELYNLGCSVYLLSRSAKRSAKAAESIQKSFAAYNGSMPPGKLFPIELDISDLEQVGRFAQTFKTEFTNNRLDFLILNAGMGALWDWKGPWTSKQNYEILFASNYLGHFLLLESLSSIMNETVVNHYSSSNDVVRPRITMTSSIMHWAHHSNIADNLLPSKNFGRSDENRSMFETMKRYGDTKLGQIYNCFEYQRRRGNSIPILPHAPGFIDTAIGAQDMKQRQGDDGSIGRVALNIEKGAKTGLHALLGAIGEEETEWNGVFLQPYYTPVHRGVPKMLGLFDLSFFQAVMEPFSQRINFGLHRWMAHPSAYDKENAAKLWDESIEAVKKYL